MRRTPKPRDSLGVRLVLAILGFCLVFTVLTVAVRTWWAWQAGVAAMSAELVLIEQVYRRTLSKGIWEMDRESLDAHMLSVANVPSVGRIVLKITPAQRAPEVLDRRQPGWSESAVAPARRLVLTYEPFQGSSETLGELSLHGDERVLWQRLCEEVWAIVITQIIQSLLLASLIMLVFSRSVTVHVQRIAHHLGRLTPSNLAEPLRLDRRNNREDELGLLVAGVNQLQGNLSDYLEQQQRYESELAQHRDRLAELVRERTGELEALAEQLAQLARSDALTGLANRRHFDETKELEFRRAQRLQQPLSLLVCDIDHFKGYNDAYGHARGDECLRAVAEAIRSSVRRAGDTVARIGGEEFAVLLSATDEAAALGMAERILEAVRAAAIAHTASSVAPVVTLSVGLAVMTSQRLSDFDALFQLADQALYRAKANGRNQVAMAGRVAS